MSASPLLALLAPSYLAERYGIPAELVKNIAGIEKIVAEAVAGGPSEIEDGHAVLGV